jgi:hypothetical protein
VLFSEQGTRCARYHEPKSLKRGDRAKAGQSPKNHFVNHPHSHLHSRPPANGASELAEASQHTIAIRAAVHAICAAVDAICAAVHAIHAAVHAIHANVHAIHANVHAVHANVRSTRGGCPQ